MFCVRARTGVLGYASLEPSVVDYLLPMYRRAVSGTDSTRCAEWWRHPEAVVRLEGPWRPWEYLRLGPGAHVRVVTVGADGEALATAHYRAGSDLALPSNVSPALLVAVVRALRDRAHEAEAPRVLHVGSLVLDPDLQVACVWVELTRREFDLLQCLAPLARVPPLSDGEHVAVEQSFGPGLCSQEAMTARTDGTAGNSRMGAARSVPCLEGARPWAMISPADAVLPKVSSQFIAAANRGAGG